MSFPFLFVCVLFTNHHFRRLTCDERFYRFKHSNLNRFFYRPSLDKYDQNSHAILNFFWFKKTYWGNFWSIKSMIIYEEILFCHYCSTKKNLQIPQLLNKQTMLTFLNLEFFFIYFLNVKTSFVRIVFAMMMMMMM